MEQAVKFTELDGRRGAGATGGAGPPLVFGGRWVTHLEREWADAHARSDVGAKAVGPNSEFLSVVGDPLSDMTEIDRHPA